MPNNILSFVRITRPKSFKTEAIAGLTTFLTMAYIVVVNPAILSGAGATPTGMAFSGVLTATVLLSLTVSLFMGIYGKLPYAVAPGMGVNAFFAYSVVIGQKVPWQMALGAVFWAGVFFVIASVTPLRVWIVRSIPEELRGASACGIGFFLTLIGLKNMGLVGANPETFGEIAHIGPSVLLGLLGLSVAVYFHHRKNPAAFLIAIGAITALGILRGDVRAPSPLVSAPDFKSVFLQFDPRAILRPELLPMILSVLFTDLFDSISTFVGVSHATGMVERDGQPKNLKQGLVVDAFATLTAGLFGTSSGTAYIESAAGIEAGGRTGWTAVFAALCFIPCFFIGPLASMIPAYATAPILVFVGALMFKSVTELKISRIEQGIPVLITILLIPITFSITQGILWGFVSHVVLYTLVGRRRDIRNGMWIIALVSAFMLWLEHGRSV